MAEVDPLILRLIADNRQYRSELQATTRRTDQLLGQMESRASAFSSRFSGALGAISVAAFARELIQLSDAAKQIDAQLRLATSNFGNFATAQEDVRRIASETRTSLEATSSLYGNFVRASQELGKSQGDAARATETFSKALKVGGADAASAASATLQFGQALASGKLGGEEFNAVAEASPRLLQLIADSMNVPRGALKALASDGKITSEVLFRALSDRRFTESLEREFKQLPVTFGEAMQAVNNAAIDVFGAFDQGGQFSNALVSFLGQGTDTFQGLSSGAEQAGIDVRASFEALGDAFEPLKNGALAALEAIGVKTGELGISIREIFGLFDEINNLYIGAIRAGERARQGYENFIGSGRRVNPTPLSNSVATLDRSRQRLGLQSQERRVNNALGGFSQGRFALRADADGRLIGVGPAARPRFTPAEEKKKGRKKTGPSAETLANRAEAARKAEVRKDERFASEKASLDADILRARQAVATAAEAVAGFERAEIEAARKRQEDEYASQVELKQIRADEAKILIAKNNELAAARTAVVDAREVERVRAEQATIAQAGLQNDRDLAAAEGALAETAQQRRDASLRLLDLEYQMERARLDAVLAAEASTEAEREIARRRMAILGQLEANDRASVEREAEGPLARYGRELNRGDRFRERSEQLVIDELQQVRDGISDALTDAIGTDDPLITGLLNLLIEQVLLKPIAAALEQAGGSGGGIGGFLSSLASSASAIFGRASGGYVGPGQTVRVNEGASPGRVELFRPNGGGTVIPLGQQSATRQGGGTIVVQVAAGEYFDARVAKVSGPIARDMSVQVTRQAAPAIIREGGKAGAALAAKDQKWSRAYGTSAPR